MDIGERLLNFIESKGISRRKFYNSIGVSSGFLSKKKNIGSDKIESILRTYPEINIKWLILGEGNMFSEKEQNTSFSHTMPVIDIHSIAEEEFQAYHQDIKNIDTISLGKSFEECSAVVQIWGDSMAPVFLAGDLAILRQVPNINYLQWGHVHLVVTKNQHFFKCVQNNPHSDKSILLESLQKEYNSFTIQMSEISRMYEARGLIRKLMT